MLPLFLASQLKIVNRLVNIVYPVSSCSSVRSRTSSSVAHFYPSCGRTCSLYPQALFCCRKKSREKNWPLPMPFFRALGDHFYKKNKALPLKEQMISALPDVKEQKIMEDDEFIIVACDGIWYVTSF